MNCKDYNKAFTLQTIKFAAAFALAEAIAFAIICAGSFAIMLAAYVSYKMGGLTVEGGRWVFDAVQLDISAMTWFAIGSILSLLCYAVLGRMRKKSNFN